MTHDWDEFSKALAQPLPRRESLKRLGLVITATVLGPLGRAFARGGHSPKQQNPCQAFCQCRNRKQLDQCLKVCQSCGSNPSRLAGACGSYFCCGAGKVACGSVCADLANDLYNCGACGNTCQYTGPYEESACVNGQCVYTCSQGAVRCNGTCTLPGSDPYNCGGCGVLCDEARANENGACIDGRCVYTCVSGATDCNGNCTFLGWDPNNCGGCGNVCPTSAPFCYNGTCIECPYTYCDGVCTDIDSDYYNCGACGNECDASFDYCEGGICQRYATPPCDPDGPYFCP